MRTDTLASVLVCLLFSAVVLADCNVDLFKNNRQIWNDDIHCFNQVDYPKYQAKSDGEPCTTNCRTLDGVESAAACHDIVKNSGCEANFFSWKGDRCWAKSRSKKSKRRDGAVSGALQASNCVTEPAYLKNCRWEETKDQDLHDTAGYIGWTCANNEILTGFELQATEDDVTKIRCCELGGHSSVIPDTCKFIDVADPEFFDEEQASCNANDHMVFSGAYDTRTPLLPGDGYTEIQVGKCCEVVCDAPWCAGKDWGVNTEQCQRIFKDPDNDGVQELVCPDGTLLTRIHDGHRPESDSPHAIQRVESVVCCALDLVAKPTKAPTTSPTPSPTRSPSPSPTDAPSSSPSPSPTDAPSSSPTDAPSQKPTPAPTTTGECLLALRCDPDMTDAEWITAIEKCCGKSIPHRRALMGRLLTEDAELPTLERPSLIKVRFNN